MKQTLLLLDILIVSYCIHRSNGFHVRFENGSEFEGRMEIQYHDDQRGTVCDGRWNHNDTQVLCRQLGFESANNTDEGYTTWFYSVSCNGTEGALEQCLNGTVWKSTREQGTGTECISSNNALSNKILEFSCNIDFRSPSSEDDNIYSYMPATASPESIRIVLSGHNTTIIIYQTHHSSPSWEIILAIVGAIVGIVGTIATVVIAATGVVTCRNSLKNPIICVPNRELLCMYTVQCKAYTRIYQIWIQS